MLNAEKEWYLSRFKNGNLTYDDLEGLIDSRQELDKQLIILQGISKADLQRMLKMWSEALDDDDGFRMIDFAEVFGSKLEHLLTTVNNTLKEDV